MAPERVLAAAGVADFDTLLPLHARFDATLGLPFDAGRCGRALAELLAAPERGRVFRVVRGAATVGYAVLCFGFSLEWGGRDAFLDEIYLDPGHRGQGLGRAALRELIDAARAAGVRALHLEVDAGNAPGQALYRSEGFSGHERQLMTLSLR